LHFDDNDIVDFTTVESYLYYTTKKQVYKTYIHDEYDKILRVANNNDEAFDYVEPFKLPNNKVLLILKGASPQFSYIVTSETRISKKITETLDESFEEFTEDMKLTMSGNHLLIPAKSKGIYLYTYNSSTNTLEFTKTFTGNNVNDITAQPNPNSSKIIGYFCDPTKGIASYELDTTTNEIEYGEFIREFIGAKTVNWISHKEDNNLLVILEGLQDTAKIILLSIDLEDLKNLEYCMECQDMAMLGLITHQ